MRVDGVVWPHVRDPRAIADAAVCAAGVGARQRSFPPRGELAVRVPLHGASLCRGAVHSIAVHRVSALTTAGACVRVCVCAQGTLIDGTVFDSSYQRNSPSRFAPNQVIKGWTEAMQLMTEGDKWEVGAALTCLSVCLCTRARARHPC